MRWEGWRSGNVEDRRGIGGGLAIGGGGLGLLAIVVISMLFGADPRQVLEQVGAGQQQQQVQQRQPGQPRPDDQLARFSAAVLGMTEQAWRQEFSARGETYQDPRMVLYDGATQTGCGGGQAAMGPFYCPLDRTIYLDLTFFRELDQRFG